MRRGTKEDIINLFTSGALVIASVDPYTIDDEEGIADHLVLITGYTSTHIIYNDVDRPGFKNRKVTWGKFEAARAENASLFSVKLQP